MKKILLSLRPQWCEKIFNGSKTIEVRKSRPSLYMPFKVYVYCTKRKLYLYKNPNNGELFLDSNGGYRGGDYEDRYLTGKVIGSFVCDDVITDFRGEHSDDFAKYALLSIDEQKKYGGNKLLYGWHITEPKLFDEPKEFYELYAPCKKNKQTADENCKGCSYAYKGVTTGEIYCDNALIRPPQSWCYVEDINEI